MDYAALKAADTALGIPDLVAATNALLLQTQVTKTPVATNDIRVALWRTNEYGKLDALYQSGCRGSYAGYPALSGKSTSDIFSALSTIISVITSNLTVTLDADWSVVTAQLDLLVSISVISVATATAIKAMRNPTIQIWIGLTPGILQLARSQP